MLRPFITLTLSGIRLGFRLFGFLTFSTRIPTARRR